MLPDFVLERSQDILLLDHRLDFLRGKEWSLSVKNNK